MKKNLINFLLELCLIKDSASVSECDWLWQNNLSEEWQCCLLTLDLHRLTPLVAYKLNVFGLLIQVPEPYREKLQASYARIRKVNQCFLLTLDAILKTMQQHKLHPVIWKGAMLADSVYPDPGTRMMGDLDFAIPSQEISQAAQVFQQLGFKTKTEMETNDATYFINDAGVLCDVHHRVRLFEGKEALGLQNDLIPQHMGVDALPVLEPNALLVHLVVHMNDHWSETGPILQWIIDIALVMQKWQDQIDIDRIKNLMPDSQCLQLFWRIVRFLDVDFGCKFSAPLSAAAAASSPLSLTRLLRQRRLIPWNLSRPRSWIKLGASQLGILSLKDHPLPLLSDWVWLPRYAISSERW